MPRSNARRIPPARTNRQSPATAPRESVNREVEVEVTGVAHGGIFVARVDGRVLFLPDTAPGEVVRARITEDKGSYARGVVLDVLTASPDRQPHVWPEAELGRPDRERPGGADFGHIRLDAQRGLKQTVISDALTRVGKLAEFPPVSVEAVGDGPVRDVGVGWRTRVGLHVAADGRTGPMASRSNDVVTVSSLPLAHPDLAELGAHLRRHEGASRVDLVRSDSGTHVLVDGQPDEVVSRTALGIPFASLASGFWQVHVDAAQTLAQAVLDEVVAPGWDPEADNLDLYGGVGLFAAAIARAGGRVTTVEADGQATELASRNLAEWQSASAVDASVRWFLRQARTSGRDLSRATVVLDPPRAGAGREVVAELVAASPARIVYVACDPVAFARDAGLLVAAGYSFASLRAFDLYPNSHHVESLAVFERGAAA